MYNTQITSDGYSPYIAAIEDAFGGNVDYAMLEKHYGGVRIGRDGVARKCRRSECSGTSTKVICGNPDPAHISTSLVERQNLTMRMSVRRLTRKTNAFSKKYWYLECTMNLYFMYYNFVRIHQTLRVTPAMEVGITDRVWTLEEIASWVRMEAPKVRAPYKKRTHETVSN